MSQSKIAELGRMFAQTMSLERFKRFIAWQEYSPYVKRELTKAFIASRT